MFRQILRALGVFIVLSLSIAAFAQTAQFSGRVTDPQRAIVRGAEVRVVSESTGVERTTKTNGDGLYSVPFVQPGTYQVFVQAQGFSTAVSQPLTVNVGQALVFDVQLKVGNATEQVTVSASDHEINTTDASVSTVVDRQFVANMPLNGRSFQSLILLAPGVLTTNPQTGTTAGVSGEFSINGQRTDTNSYSVDGLSANNGVAPGYGGAGNAGSLASFSALGTTQALVSVDALQEFSVATSTYSAEYGRQPGGQISFQTRSGTNDFHGTAFDYFRNDALDANNWFNDYSTPIIPKPAERQNDFGGVLGGPLDIPHVYSGRNRTFFFISYEGLRLSQPQPAQIFYVPSNGTNNTATYSNPQYKNLRANAPVALQPVLNAFATPNCTVQQNAQCIDYGDGLAPYILSTSLPSSLNSISGRADYQVTPSLRLFFRYADTTSSAVTSVTTYSNGLNYRTQTFSFGADNAVSSSISNNFRLGYSPTHGTTVETPTPGGGADPVDLLALQRLGPLGSASTVTAFSFPNGELSYLYDDLTGSKQHQWNVVDTLSWSLGAHIFRMGIDYRRTTSYQNYPGFSQYPSTEYIYLSASSVLQNAAALGLITVATEQDPAFTNFSAFAQDEWHLRPRVNLSFGVRWELNPPPSVVGGSQQRTLDGSFADPASLTLAPVGTSLYSTTYYNFAPRLGVAATLRNQPGHETIFRAGGGVYFDAGQSFTFYGSGYSPGIGANAIYSSTPFPLTSAQTSIVPSLTPPYGTMYVVSRSLQLPYTFQWNASLEQALGTTQSITLGYVGSNGRRLLQLQPYSLATLNPSFTTIDRFQNGLSSSYNAMQVQYKRVLSRGLQVLAGYTWSHAFDYESRDNGLVPYQRGNSDNDVRDNFTTALSYNVPGAYNEYWRRALLGGWGMDLRLTSRTAFPVEVQGPLLTDPLGNEYYGLLNYNGTDPYVHKQSIPGGRQFNVAAFSVPKIGQSGNSPRNFLRGFGENEVNLALRREFPLHEKAHLQFRGEAFNLLNHPNFGRLNLTCGTSTAGATCTNLLFGQAQGTLASALGGGLTQLYQQGGPRSLQLALKIIF